LLPSVAELFFPNNDQKCLTLIPEHTIQLIDAFKKGTDHLPLRRALLQDAVNGITHKEKIENLNPRSLQVGNVTVILSDKAFQLLHTHTSHASRSIFTVSL
jgi:hypothetical protein